MPNMWMISDYLWTTIVMDENIVLLFFIINRLNTTDSSIMWFLLKIDGIKKVNTIQCSPNDKHEKHYFLKQTNRRA